MSILLKQGKLKKKKKIVQITEFVNQFMKRLRKTEVVN